MRVDHDHINYLGRDGFYWFLGVVEDRDDPEKLGRVRVRCFGLHTDNREMIPTDGLPWAQVIQAPNVPAAYAPKNGDYVFGFFLDSDAAQQPVVMGVLPGKPIKKPNYTKGFSDARKDLSKQPVKEKYPLQSRIGEPTLNRLSRGKATSTIIEKRKKSLKKDIKSAMGSSWSEPSPTFDPAYPFNYAHESEAGHAFELDDTPGKERVHLAHTIGAFIEMDAEGNRIEKIIKDKYTVVMGSDNVYIGGKCNITVDGNCNLKVGGKFNLEADEINMSATKGINVKGLSFSADATGAVDIRGGASAKVGSSGVLGLSGTVTTLSGVSVSVAGATVGIQMGTPDPPSGLPDFIQDVPVDQDNLPTTELSNLEKGKSFVQTAKEMVGRVKENIQKVADKINDNMINNPDLKLAKSFGTSSLNEGKLSFDGVVDAFNELDYSTNFKESLIAKDLFPKTSYVEQSDDLDEAGQKVNKMVSPLKGLNDRVVDLNHKTFELDGMADPLNDLNSSMNEINNHINSAPNVEVPIPNIGQRLTQVLPQNSGINTEYGVA